MSEVPSVARHLLENAIRLHSAVPVRSERHEHFLDLFVEVPQVEMLDRSDWQVIFGRRGTGKTHLLGIAESKGAVAVQSTDDFYRVRDLCLRLSAQEFIVSPVGHEVSDRLRGIAYFQTFLELLCDTISDRVDEFLKSPGLAAILTGSRRRLRSQLEDATIALLQAAQVGTPLGAYAPSQVRTEHFVAEERSRSLRGGANASLGGQGVALSASAGAGVANARHENQTRTESRESDPIPRYTHVRKQLLAILDFLNVRRLNLLIDEWSLLDTTASTAIQPEFADLLKRSFAGTDRISVKIATNRYQTRFNNRGAGSSFRGLELGADIFEGANLDRAILRDDELAKFFETMLFKRMCFVERKLRVFEKQRSDTPVPAFILAIFRTRDAFTELVKGAAGVPRDFLSLFNELAERKSYSLSSKWQTREVRDTVRLRSTRGQTTVDHASIANRMLMESVYPVVQRTHSRLFIVPHLERDRLSDAFDELFEKRFIHDFDQQGIPAPVRARLGIYTVDYGLYLDWDRSTDRPRNSVQSPRFNSPQGLQPYLLDLTALGHEDLKQCPSCQSHFSPSAKSFRLKGLCPECFEFAESTEG